MRADGVGLGLAVLSASTAGTAGSFATSLLDAGWSPAAAVIARVGIAALLLTVPAVRALRGHWSLVRRDAGALVLFGAFAVAGAQVFFFNAVQHLSVGVALLLEYSGTVLVVLWMWLRHGQRPGRRTVLGGLVAIAGLVLVLDLTGSQHVDVVGILWGLGAAAGLAVYFVLSARESSGGAGLPPIAMAWFGMALGAPVLLVLGLAGVMPLHAATAPVVLAGHHMSWLVPVIGLALVAAAIAYVAGIEAARRLGARLASFVGLAEVLFAILFAWLLLSQRPTLLQGFGGLLVLGGIALLRTGDRPAAAEADEAAVLALAAS